VSKLIVLTILAHYGSYSIIAWRANMHLEGPDQEDRRISMFIIGPKALANLWQMLFGFRFVSYGDRVLTVASIIHILTTLGIVGIMLSWLFE